MVFPLVTDADRKWAMAQCPPWARCDYSEEDFPEIVDDGGWLENARTETLPTPNWADFVHEQAERFEKFFQGQDKTYGDWSRLWRKSWWPKADPAKRWPKMAKKEFHPFFRRGTKEFRRALDVASPVEKRMWERFGVAQFKPDDPRLKMVEEAAGAKPTQ
jgi:hypothetical protein